MRKKLFLLFAVLVTAITASAYDFEVGGIYYNVLSEEDLTCEVTLRDTNYNCYSGHVVIPASVTYNEKTFAVTQIGISAFFACNSLTSVEVGNSVTKIANRAFHSCTSLTSVVISNSVTEIGESAFSYCSSLKYFAGKFASDDHRYLVVDGVLNSFASAGLTTYKIPDSIKEIGNCAFEGRSNLTSIVIPNSVSSIGYYAFYDCSSLTSVVIPNSVTKVEESVFGRCSNLTTVEIPSSVTEIGVSAFAYCSSLTSVQIPNSVTKIGGTAFLGCSKLMSVQIGNSVTTIGERAFRGCSNLTSVIIPNSVTKIGGSAFYGCSGLASVVIPNDVTSIGRYTFYNCSNLVSVAIPNSVTEIGDYAFSGCSRLKSLVTPDSLAAIGERAFGGCTSLQSVEIPNTVTLIGKFAFYNCSGLSEITSLAVTPPSIYSNTFEGVSKTETEVKVPVGAVRAYRAANYWNAFLNIKSLNDDSEGSEGDGIGEVVDVSELSNEKVYTIKCGRDYLGVTSEGIMNDVSVTGAVYSSAGDDNLFAIYKGAFGYYFYAIRRGLFVPAQGRTTWDVTVSALEIPDGYYIIEPYSDATYNGFTMTSGINGCWMMLGGNYQWLGSDSWSSANVGDIWTIAECDEILDAETLNTIAAKVNEYENPEGKQCAEPTIEIVDGKLAVASETEGAVCTVTITSADINVFDVVEPLELTGVYNISAYAHVLGLNNSDTVVATLVWVLAEEGATGLLSMDAKKAVVIRGLDGKVVVIGTEQGESVQLYTIDGLQIASVTADSDQTVIPCSVAKGEVVVVKYGGKSVKIVM